MRDKRRTVNVNLRQSSKITKLVNRGWRLVVCVYHEGGYPQCARIYSPKGAGFTVRSDTAADSIGWSYTQKKKVYLD